MKARELSRNGERRTCVLVFATGDEVTSLLLAFAREHHINAAHFTGIGALQNVRLGYWDWQRKEYLPIAIDEQVEVLALTGNIASGPDGSPRLHAHIVIGKSDGSAHGGHLLEARVRPTLEIVLTEAPAELRRVTDEDTGLALLALD
jgi:predicted DNA-binding protein with PD1-like motif